MAAIEVEDLQKSFGTVCALAGISFSVAGGETVAVLGPNGAGKTTAMEILEGYQRPDGGRARVLGVDPSTGGSELRQRIGIVLQEAGVDAYLSVREVVTRYAELYRRPRDVTEVVHLVGLEEKAEARAPRACPAARSAASTSRSDSSVTPSCCSSTSPRPVSTRRPGGPPGRPSRT